MCPTGVEGRARGRGQKRFVLGTGEQSLTHLTRSAPLATASDDAAVGREGIEAADEDGARSLGQF